MTSAFFVYILHSQVLGKYYVGFTSDVKRRLEHHNAGKNRFSKNGIPWTLVASFPSTQKAEAHALEKKIKARGAKRFLEDQRLL
ncbi:MAG: GIY-YIG nuclease family protein [Saprospiraceae bacterium]|nr:GIY-YIG nuclease family protein [Saprospiraceae bacterium]